MADDFDHELYDLLLIIDQACARCMRLTTRYSLGSFLQDEGEQLAIAKAIEQIGEHANRLIRKRPDFNDRHPELMLGYAVRMRNRLAHGYEDIDYPTLWEIATTSVPDLQGRLESILREAGDDVA
ncbi:Uncharacterized conserved protein, contains HEPN domain [Fulvimarina manganoxydans]|uniref:Uncharacterized conserved protein, contains HEPN domain n=1 Tax=Fulvimarina manganoxydans TaxID=937218 RepID=A0A1W1ZX04_9HYPH|nr:HepT-like ribonuclease domain-containing protein [Fulvimarina manganoxydans]MEE2952084.1 HepT-like ribonuclease domain-containing protein [Pseudomonadota bacterium]SMC52772.1 Uncharacterized conserved protein, contains HEPN domain [Fulvimarina manganoxydans]